MFGNWAEETTTTTGTGTLTLAAVSGKPRIANVFPVGEHVSYAILDAAGDPIEAGIGKVAASNTIERTIVRATYVSSTYTGANASAVSLAAGTKTVIATPISGSFLGAAPGLNSSATVRIIFSPSYYLTNGDSAALGTSNTCIYVPFLMTFGCDIDGIMIEVATAGAGNIRLGIYSVGGDGKPNTKIAETADVSCATTGIKTGTLTRRTLPPGWYYLAVASKGVAISIAANGAGSEDKAPFPTPLGFASFANAYAQASETLSGGWTDLPATANGTLTYDTITSTFAPRIGLKPA